MTEEADWVTTAMADNDVVADVLVKIRIQPSLKHPRPFPPQSWTVHQHRSRTQPATSNKQEPSPMTSPITPLSWSGATSEGLDSTLQPINNCSETSKAKVKRPNETTPTKRTRKKKSLAALREEGIVLMEEQNDLKRKLAALQATCEKQRKENERLKKIKLDVQLEPHDERPKTRRNEPFEMVNMRKYKTLLPDLNVPLGEDVIVSY